MNTVNYLAMQNKSTVLLHTHTHTLPAIRQTAAMQWLCSALVFAISGAHVDTH